MISGQASRQARTASRSAGTTAARLATHEAVCAERYAAVLTRLGRLEKIIITANGGLIVGLAVVAWFFFTQRLG